MALKVGNGLDLQGQKAIHAADGSASDDLATYGQLLKVINGIITKGSSRAASTGNVTVGSAPASLDGVTLASLDRVLLKNQTAPAENGIYVYSATGSPLVRAGDFNSTSNILAGSTTTVLEGTVGAPGGAPTNWTLAIDPDTVIVVGTTALPFTQTNADVVYSPGNGLQLVSTTFSVKLPGSGVIGLVVDGTGVYIDTTVVVRKFAVLIGDGATTAITVTHNLGTRDCEVAVYDAATFAEIITDIARTTINTLTVTFAVAPASNAYRVVVQA